MNHQIYFFFTSGHKNHTQTLDSKADYIYRGNYNYFESITFLLISQLCSSSNQFLLKDIHVETKQNRDSRSRIEFSFINIPNCIIFCPMLERNQSFLLFSYSWPEDCFSTQTAPTRLTKPVSLIQLYITPWLLIQLYALTWPHFNSNKYRHDRILRSLHQRVQFTLAQFFCVSVFSLFLCHPCGLSLALLDMGTVRHHGLVGFLPTEDLVQILMALHLQPHLQDPGPR